MACLALLCKMTIKAESLEAHVVMTDLDSGAESLGAHVVPSLYPVTSFHCHNLGGGGEGRWVPVGLSGPSGRAVPSRPDTCGSSMGCQISLQR